MRQITVNSITMNTQKKIGLILDFDDTIINNTKLDLDSFHYIARIYNLPPIDDKTIIRWRKNGMLAKNILQRLIRQRIDISLDTCIKKRLEYLKVGAGGIKLAETKVGVINALKQLKRRGYFITVVTSRQDKALVKKIINYQQLSSWIDEIYCASDLTNKKFDFKDCIELKKSLYNLVLKNHFPKLQNEQIVAVGNLKADIIAAKQLRIKPIAIKGSYRFDSGISRLCKTITDFDELLNIL
jgi:phosphoglycolate phosphatase-like HAD superfamily hydrolase